MLERDFKFLSPRTVMQMLKAKRLRTVEHSRRRRGKKWWEDNIKEWTGIDFARLTMAAENRTRWKKIVANSSVVPRRPSKLMG